MTDVLPPCPHLRLVSNRDVRPDPQAEEEADRVLLAQVQRLPPTQRRILAMVMSRIDQMQDDEAAVALIEKVIATLRR